MTVAELRKILETMPQDAEVYAEGEPADKVITEGYHEDGTPMEGYAQIVRIFKAWDVKFINSPRMRIEQE